jgi:hypothetical protein
LLSRDREDGRATWQPSHGTAGLVPRRTWTVRRRVSLSCLSRACLGERSRRNTRGRQEGRPYPWSQQVIHKISGLENNVLVSKKAWRTRGSKMFVEVGTILSKCGIVL